MSLSLFGPQPPQSSREGTVVLRIFAPLTAVASLFAVLLTTGCSAPGTAAQIAASSSQVDGVMPVHVTFERKSDRWYDIGVNESLAFGGWHTGVIDRNLTKGSGVHIQASQVGWVNRKTATTLSFDLHSPHSEVCHISINSSRKDKDWEIGGVVIGSGDDKVTGTITFANGTSWPFEVDSFHSESVIGGNLSGTVQVGSETVTIREDNSANRVVGALTGLAGASFVWNGQRTGKVSFVGEGMKLNERSVEITPNLPAPIQTATAAMAATLLIVQKIGGPSEQSSGARKFEF